MECRTPEAPHRDKKLMRDMYVRRNYSAKDIAGEFDLHPRTIREWLKKHDIQQPWRDEDVLYEMYIEDGLTQGEIANRFNCRETTISKWIRRHGIETPSGAELVKPALEARRTNHAAFYTELRGYEVWDSGGDGKDMYVHRLLAVAKYGLDSVIGKQVHHKNGIKWDNRPSNIDILENSEHQKLHGRHGTWSEGSGPPTPSR
jgi:transposase-like protein